MVDFNPNPRVCVCMCIYIYVVIYIYIYRYTYTHVQTHAWFCLLAKVTGEKVSRMIEMWGASGVFVQLLKTVGNYRHFRTVCVGYCPHSVTVG